MDLTKALKSVDIDFQISRDNIGLGGKILEVNKNLFLKGFKIYLLNLLLISSSGVEKLYELHPFKISDTTVYKCERSCNVFCEIEIGYSSI